MEALTRLQINLLPSKEFSLHFTFRFNCIQEVECAFICSTFQSFIRPTNSRHMIHSEEVWLVWNRGSWRLELFSRGKLPTRLSIGWGPGSNRRLRVLLCFNICLLALPAVGWTYPECCRLNSFAVQIGPERWRDGSQARGCYRNFRTFSIPIHDLTCFKWLQTCLTSDNRLSGPY